MERIEPEAVEEYFLRKAAPEVVYDYLRRQFVRKGMLDRPFSKEIQKSLLARHDPIIDLALAQFSDCDEVIFELLSRDDSGLRIAVLSNKNRFRHLGDLKDASGRLPEEVFQQLIRRGLRSQYVRCMSAVDKEMPGTQGSRRV